jgi:hypothetical protein
MGGMHTLNQPSCFAITVARTFAFCLDSAVAVVLFLSFPLSHPEPRDPITRPSPIQPSKINPKTAACLSPSI